MYALRSVAASQARRLLRVLLVWFRKVPARAAEHRGRSSPLTTFRSRSPELAGSITCVVSADVGRVDKNRGLISMANRYGSSLSLQHKYPNRPLWSTCQVSPSLQCTRGEDMPHATINVTKTHYMPDPLRSQLLRIGRKSQKGVDLALGE